MHGVKALLFDVGGTVFDWKNTAHKGDLAAAQAAGMRTAYVNVPEEDNMANFGQAGEAEFDIEANDFDALCKALQV